MDILRDGLWKRTLEKLAERVALVLARAASPATRALQWNSHVARPMRAPGAPRAGPHPACWEPSRYSGASRGPRVAQPLSSGRPPPPLRSQGTHGGRLRPSDAPRTPSRPLPERPERVYATPRCTYASRRRRSSTPSTRTAMAT
eukprot:7898316-Lingulodinium_polyedra.AAC.1